MEMCILILTWNRFNARTNFKKMRDEMQRKYDILSKTILFLLFPVMFSACAGHQSNVGKTVVDEHVLPAVETASSPGKWQTNDLRILYYVKQAGDSYTVTGELQIDNYIIQSFPLVENFRFFINYLDENDTVISSNDISPAIGYRKYIPEFLSLRNVPTAPPNSTSFAFSYWGTFAGYNNQEESTGDWTIHFSPFGENR